MSGVPVGWEMRRLGDLGRYLNGRAFKSSDWGTEGRPIIRIQNLTGSGDQFNYFAGEVEDRYVVRPGDLLVSWSATLGAYFWDGPEGVLNQHIFKVDSNIDKRFHKYLIESKIAEMLSQTHGSGMVHITKSKFDAIPVAVPPLDEQQRIVATLEDHLSRLDAAEATVDVVETKARLLRAAAFEACARPITVYSKSKDWQNLRFKEIASIDADLRDPGEFPDWPHIAPNHIERESGRLLEFTTVRADGVTSPKHVFRAGQILYSKIRPYLNKVALPDFEGLCSADMYPISTEQDVEWLYYAMLSPTFVRKTSGEQNRTVLPKINANSLRAIEVMVPPPAHQIELRERAGLIVGAVARVEASAAAARKRAKTLRRSLLQAAFTGELTKEHAFV